MIRFIGPGIYTERRIPENLFSFKASSARVQIPPHPDPLPRERKQPGTAFETFEPLSLRQLTAGDSPPPSGRGPGGETGRPTKPVPNDRSGPGLHSHSRARRSSAERAQTTALQGKGNQTSSTWPAKRSASRTKLESYGLTPSPGDLPTRRFSKAPLGAACHAKTATPRHICRS